MPHSMRNWAPEEAYQVVPLLWGQESGVWEGMIIEVTVAVTVVETAVVRVVEAAVEVMVVTGAT